jgi:hypothetical protein
MLKRGIYEVGNLKKQTPHPKKRISIALYEALNSLPDPVRSQLQEHVLWRLSTSSRVNKRTYKNRFGEFDSIVVESIKNIYKNHSSISVHDVGVSDGRTSLELYCKLKLAMAATVFFLASDAHHTFTSISRNGRRLAVILDNTDSAVQVVCPPFVFDTIKRDKLFYYPVNRLILFWLLRGSVKKLLSDYRLGAPDLLVKKIDVIDPECMVATTTNNNFRYTHYNILKPMDKQFDVIRAMNILNYDYFSSSQIATATRNCCKGLRNGGLFITGSNSAPGSVVDGSIFRKDGKSLAEIVKVGRGSVIRESLLTSGSDFC